MKKNQFSNSLFILLTAGIMACTSTETKQEKAPVEPTETTMKTLDDFGIRATNVFLYYEDLAGAADFYTQTLGLEQVADYGMARILRVARDSYFILVDATKGMHTAEEPKTVAMALITDQLDEWYDYLVGEGYTMKYEYKPKDGSAHDGSCPSSGGASHSGARRSSGTCCFGSCNQLSHGRHLLPLRITELTLLCGSWPDH